MKILMIAPEPFFEPRGTPFSIFGRLRALSQLGHEVDLLTYHIGETPVIPGVSIVRTPVLRFIQQIPIGPSPAKVLLDFFLIIRALNLMIRKRYDLLHTHEEAGFFGILLARLFRTPHLYDMHSSLPQQLLNFRFVRSRPLVRLFEWLERQTINGSDAVITICPALEERVRSLNGRVPHLMIENVSAIRNDTQIVSEESLRRFKAEHFLDGKKVVLYTGNFEPYQGIDLLISSAHQVLSRSKDVLFLLIGGKLEQVRRYQNIVDNLNISSHFHFTGIRPYQEIAWFTRIADVLVSPRILGTNTPLKVYEYLQSGKPIVATDLQTHTQILDNTVALLVEPSAHAMANGILSVLDDPVLARKLGAQARQLYEKRYSYQMFVKKTEQVIQMAVA